MKLALVLLLAFIGFQSQPSSNDAIRVFLLTDPADPVQLSRAVFSQDDPASPAITMLVENTTEQALTTRDLWLSLARFYSRAEMARNADRIFYNCGWMGRADHSEPAKDLPTRVSVAVKIVLPPGCTLKSHEHFFVTAQQVGGNGRFGRGFWKREPEDFARLLTAAMPHP